MDILGLLLSPLGIFLSEYRTHQANNAQEFMEWLSRHNYKMLRDAIESNQVALAAIDLVLSDNRQLMIDRFDRIENLMVASLVSGDDNLAKLSLALNPKRTLSEQAISILRQMIDSGCSRFVFAGRGMAEPILSKMDGGDGNIEYTDRQFIEDDLTVLVRVGLLNSSISGTGGREYGATRSAKEFLRALG